MFGGYLGLKQIYMLPGNIPHFCCQTLLFGGATFIYVFFSQ